ncbi:MAG: hypothetical protein QOF49_1839, partial [Chloroflexota bacterium]|nr:hypothetical protein [Chloroflexota bacterium]
MRETRPLDLVPWLMRASSGGPRGDELDVVGVDDVEGRADGAIRMAG